MEYRIYEKNYKNFIRKINRIKNKCDKQGIPFTFKEKGECFETIPVVNENGVVLCTSDGKTITRTIKKIIVDVEGKLLYNNWLLIGSLEPITNMENGYVGNRILEFPEQKEANIKIPKEYYNKFPTCDHCHTNRKRKNVYLIYNVESNEFKQVGSDCLQEFTNGLDANLVAEIASLYNDEIEEITTGEYVDFVYSGTKGGYISVEDILTITAEAYTKTGIKDYYMIHNYYNVFAGIKMLPDAERSTINSIRDNNIDFENKKSRAFAKECIEYYKNFPEDRETSYEHNIKMSILEEFVKDQQFNLVSSSFYAYNGLLQKQKKEVEKAKQLEEKRKNSCWIGKIGDKITIEIKSINTLASWKNSYSYYGDIVNMYEITDIDDNIYIWKTTNSCFVVDDNVLNCCGEPQPAKYLKGTIKDHQKYKDIEQTILSNCKLALNREDLYTLAELAKIKRKKEKKEKGDDYER